jgi:hypothetical protein
MVRFMCVENWNSNNYTFKATLQNIQSGIAYDKDGNKLEHPWIEVYNPWKQAVCSGMVGWACYNPNLTYPVGYDYITNSTKLGKHQKYELLQIESPLATIYTTGGGSGTIYSLTMSPPNANINWDRWHTVKVLNAPNISGYYITAQLTSILGEIGPDPTGGTSPISGSIGHLVFVPTDFPTPIEGAIITAANEARIDRTGDILSIRNSLNVGSGFKVNIQWNGNEWITINSEGYNTPVLGTL